MMGHDHASKGKYTQHRDSVRVADGKWVCALAVLISDYKGATWCHCYCRPGAMTSVVIIWACEILLRCPQTLLIMASFVTEVLNFPSDDANRHLGTAS